MHMLIARPIVDMMVFLQEVLVSRIQIIQRSSIVTAKILIDVIVSSLCNKAI